MVGLRSVWRVSGPRGDGALVPRANHTVLCPVPCARSPPLFPFPPSLTRGQPYVRPIRLTRFKYSCVFSPLKKCIPKLPTLPQRLNYSIPNSLMFKKPFSCSFGKVLLCLAVPNSSLPPKIVRDGRPLYLCRGLPYIDRFHMVSYTGYLLFSLTESTFRFHTLGVRLCISVASVSYARVVCPSHARHSPISLL